jgi:hypothetical protein
MWWSIHPGSLVLGVLFLAFSKKTTYEIKHGENVTHWDDYPKCEIPPDSYRDGRKEKIINT